MFIFMRGRKNLFFPTSSACQRVYNVAVGVTRQRLRIRVMAENDLTHQTNS